MTDPTPTADTVSRADVLAVLADATQVPQYRRARYIIEKLDALPSPDSDAMRLRSIADHPTPWRTRFEGLRPWSPHDDPDGAWLVEDAEGEVVVYTGDEEDSRPLADWIVLCANAPDAIAALPAQPTATDETRKALERVRDEIDGRSWIHYSGPRTAHLIGRLLGAEVARLEDQ